MDQNRMSIDKKWNKWLIIGGLVVPYPLVILFAYMEELFNSAFWVLSLVILVPLCICAFWLGILNYTKLHPGIKFLLAFILAIVSAVVILIILVKGADYSVLFM